MSVLQPTGTISLYITTCNYSIIVNFSVTLTSDLTLVVRLVFISVMMHMFTHLSEATLFTDTDISIQRGQQSEHNKSTASSIITILILASATSPSQQWLKLLKNRVG